MSKHFKIVELNVLKFSILLDRRMTVVEVWDTKEAILPLLESRLHKNLASVVLFGSVVKKDKKPQDIDVLIISRGLPGGWRERDKIAAHLAVELLERTGKRFSPQLYSKEEFEEEILSSSPFLNSLLTGYSILYDPESFFKQRIDAIRRRTEISPMVYVERGRRWVLGKET